MEYYSDASPDLDVEPPTTSDRTASTNHSYLLNTNRGNKLRPGSKTIRRGQLGGWSRAGPGGLLSPNQNSTSSFLHPHPSRFAEAEALQSANRRKRQRLELGNGTAESVVGEGLDHLALGLQGGRTEFPGLELIPDDEVDDLEPGVAEAASVPFLPPPPMDILSLVVSNVFRHTFSNGLPKRSGSKKSAEAHAGPSSSSSSTTQDPWADIAHQSVPSQLVSLSEATIGLIEEDKDLLSCLGRLVEFLRGDACGYHRFVDTNAEEGRNRDGEDEMAQEGRSGGIEEEGVEEEEEEERKPDVGREGEDSEMRAVEENGVDPATATAADRTDSPEQLLTNVDGGEVAGVGTSVAAEKTDEGKDGMMEVDGPETVSAEGGRKEGEGNAPAPSTEANESGAKAEAGRTDKVAEPTEPQIQPQTAPSGVVVATEIEPPSSGASAEPVSADPQNDPIQRPPTPAPASAHQEQSGARDEDKSVEGGKDATEKIASQPYQGQAGDNLDMSEKTDTAPKAEGQESTSIQNQSEQVPPAQDPSEVQHKADTGDAMQVDASPDKAEAGTVEAETSAAPAGATAVAHAADVAVGEAGQGAEPEKSGDVPDGPTDEVRVVAETTSGEEASRAGEEQKEGGNAETVQVTDTGADKTDRDDGPRVEGGEVQTASHGMEGSPPRPPGSRPPTRSPSPGPSNVQATRRRSGRVSRRLTADSAIAAAGRRNTNDGASSDGEGTRRDEDDDGEGLSELAPNIHRILAPESFIRSLFVSDHDVTIPTLDQSQSTRSTQHHNHQGEPMTETHTPDGQMAILQSSLTELSRFLADCMEYREKLGEIRDGILGVERRRKGLRSLIRMRAIDILDSLDEAQAQAQAQVQAQVQME